MYTDSSLQPIHDNAQYVSIKDGTQYPKNRDKNTIVELTRVTETLRPTGKFVTGYHIDETFTQVWDFREKTKEELVAESKEIIQNNINLLELEITPRRQREFLLNEEYPVGWYKAQNELIKKERAKLK